MDVILEKIFEKIPRKMVVGLFAMWMVAEKTKELEPDKQIWCLVAMTVIALASIGTHFFLEYKNPSNGDR